MDTRGRHGDQRFEPRTGTPPPSKARPTPAGSDDAELVDLTPVGRKPRTPLGGLWTLVAFGVILAGLTGISLLPRDTSPAPSTSPTQAALAEPASPGASQPATPALSSDPSPGASARTAPRPTSRPSPRPVPTTNAAAWGRAQTGFQTDLSPSAMWALGGRVMILGETYSIAGTSRWTILGTDEHGNWNAWDVPGAITFLSRGVVFEERIWFAARFELPGESWVELVSTSYGVTWDSHGRIEAEGVDVSHVSSLARIDGRWVALVAEQVPADGGDRREHILVSRGDGWRVVDTALPEGTSIGGRLGLRGDRLVLLGGLYLCCEGGRRMYAATSHDGITWEVTDPALPAQVLQLNDLQCRSTGCILIASSEDGSYYRNRLFVSADGLDWTAMDLPALDTIGNREFAGLAVTESGFLMTVFPSVHAWVFDDVFGAFAVDVLPANAADRPYHIAVDGTEVYGVGHDQNGYLVIWHGDLSRMH